MYKSKENKGAELHARQRCAERYKINLTNSDYLKLSRKIMNGRSVPLCTRSRLREIHAVKYQSIWFPIVFSSVTQAIITILPKDVIKVPINVLEEQLKAKITKVQLKKLKFGIYLQKSNNEDYILQTIVEAESINSAMFIYLRKTYSSDYNTRWEKRSFQNNVFTIQGHSYQIIGSKSLPTRIITKKKKNKHVITNKRVPEQDLSEVSFEIYTRFKNFPDSQFKKQGRFKGLSAKSAIFSYIRKIYSLDFQKRWESCSESKGVYTFGWLEVKAI